VIVFKTIKEAKDFLADSIATEAMHEGTPLSEIERKMLYFSETDWTLPDITALNAEFDRDCNENEYQQKIARLVQRIRARNHAQNPVEEEAWDEALLMLSEGHHYLSVLITKERKSHTVRHLFIPTLETPTVRPPHDRLALWVTSFAAFVGLLALIGLYTWLIGHGSCDVTEQCQAIPSVAPEYRPPIAYPQTAGPLAL
jgi:hypothetical protein